MLRTEIPNHKIQIPNKFQIPILKIPNMFWSFEFRSLVIVCNLVLVIWCFRAERGHGVPIEE